MRKKYEVSGKIYHHRSDRNNCCVRDKLITRKCLTQPDARKYSSAKYRCLQEWHHAVAPLYVTALNRVPPLI